MNTTPTLADIHDYELVQVSTKDAPREVQFQFRDENNTLVCWIMHGVVMMRLTEMYEGNCVLECEKLIPERVPRELWQRLLENRVHAKNVDEEISRLKRKVGPNGAFISITPSYGMTCCLLCERITEISP